MNDKELAALINKWIAKTDLAQHWLNVSRSCKKLPAGFSTAAELEQEITNSPSRVVALFLLLAIYNASLVPESFTRLAEQKGLLRRPKLR